MNAVKFKFRPWKCGVKLGRSRRAPVAILCVSIALTTMMIHASDANAESLRQAMRDAYQSNPALDAERARLRAIDEEVPKARSGYRPTVTGDASITRIHTKSDPLSTNDGGLSPTTLQLNMTQPLFTGFRTTTAVNQAEAQVRAGRQNLRRVENTTMLEAATVYMDVIRDQAILRLRQRNVAVLTRELEAAQARRAVREVTLTDVAQARARRARSVSASDFAKANLRIARANYKRVIGHAPAGLSQPPQRLRNLPRSLNDALTIADRESPNVVSALYREQAARLAVDQVWGELLPQVQLEANYVHQTQPSQLFDTTDTASITGRVTIPFYKGGEVHARVRQAKHTHVSRLQEIEQARNEDSSNVTAAWSRLVSARAQLSSDEVQVQSARTALEGVREEEKVGQRTLLDVLNAEQEYLDAQVSRVSTRRDLVVASYALLARIGRLTADRIDEIEEVYVPEANYEEARPKWVGITITHAEEPKLPDVLIDVRPSLVEDTVTYDDPRDDSPDLDGIFFKNSMK